MLAQLGSVISPARAGGVRPASAMTGLTGASFEELLGQARRGEAGTGLPVREARGAGLNLSDEQLEKLAAAADRASAEGLSRAMVLLDGAAYELDVQMRTVVARIELSDGNPVRGFDGVIDGVVDAGAGGPVSIVSADPNEGKVDGVRALADLAGRAVKSLVG